MKAKPRSWARWFFERSQNEWHTEMPEIANHYWQSRFEGGQWSKPEKID